jgi:hypothetical protein
MENPGERLVGDYLRYIKGCDFIDFNVYTKLVQGEIDVIGVNHTEKTAYICEAVTHLATGIQYVDPKSKQPDTAARLTKKFIKGIAYGKTALRDYNVFYMLWSPVVHPWSGKSKYDQFAHLNLIIDDIRKQTGVTVQLVINNDYLNAIGELRAHAAKETKELKSPVMRFLQIEEWSKKNCNKIAEKTTNSTSSSPSEVKGDNSQILC